MTELAASNLVSTTVEDAVLEILGMIADLQSNTATNPQNRTMITSFTQNELTGTISVTLTIPSTVTHTAEVRVANATELFS
ncbi:hypothetical protein IQ269_19235 [Tychonema sp. LEGE 07199]|uniref:hypothetical protein n=1 Tax=unclassified Tychonema TaxID=2642144 RepID=UPI001881CA87|nr:MULTISPECIES: hypothetical protein [unclassified Tychonema]MBE9122872.1 hypothetical protein [Tychonema sp. LEGE 07199]MBE9134727.1 hypothetical protein [Tychonema sp. LEGE 07196]